MIWVGIAALYALAFAGVFATTFAFAPNALWPVAIMFAVATIVAVVVRRLHARAHDIFLVSAFVYFGAGVLLALALNAPAFVEAFLGFGIVFFAFAVFTRSPA